MSINRLANKLQPLDGMLQFVRARKTWHIEKYSLTYLTLTYSILFVIQVLFVLGPLIYSLLLKISVYYIFDFHFIHEFQLIIYY